jgi:anti-sigma-K factor RskA
MTITDDLISLAAEFVLGSLPGEDKVKADALIASDPEFAELVKYWERRLGELNVLVAAVEPPPDLFDKIKEKLADTEQAAGMRLPDVAAPPRPVITPPVAAPLPKVQRVTPQQMAAPKARDQAAALRQRMRRLRDFGAAMTAIAALLAAFIVTSIVRPDLIPARLKPRGTGGAVVATPAPSAPPVSVGASLPAQPGEGQLVAVLQRDAASPAFVITVDPAARTLVVRRVSADHPVGRQYQLWLVSTNFPQPRPLGLISREDFTTTQLQTNYEPTAVPGALFAVSLEPEGGSPTGFPTGPVLWSGRLIEATPPPPQPPPRRR